MTRQFGKFRSFLNKVRLLICSFSARNEPLDDIRVWFQADIPTAFPWLGLNKGTLGFLTSMRHSAASNLFAIGEYFDSNIDELHRYIQHTYAQISLFDFPLQRKLVQASRSGNAFDMASLQNGTLTREQAVLSVDQ